MATIIHLRDSKHASETHADHRTPTLLVGTLLLALAIVLGAPTIGFAVAGLFGAGMLLAHVERRFLGPAEFALISALHTVAVVLLAF